MPDEKLGRVLVYRLGSIGDCVVALPCFHLIRRRYPVAQIALLTNQPVESRAAPAASVLEGMGLVQQYISYPQHTRDPQQISRLRQSVRSFKPDLAVYLAASRGTFSVYRDYLFFRWCGIGRILGVPFSRDLQHCRPPASLTGLWEAEAHRLARCLAPLGAAEAERAENWDLRLSPAEIAEADRILRVELPDTIKGLPLLGASIGTKHPTNDWGNSNWHKVFGNLGTLGFGLVLIGAAEERLRSQEVAKAWSGPVLNLCGQTSPRLSAAVMRRMKLFLCHDSGPMHLAAAVGTRCVAVFSRLYPPGQWFPFGSHHAVLYPPSPTDTIQAIEPSEVIRAAHRMLGKQCEP